MRNLYRYANKEEIEKSRKITSNGILLRTYREERNGISNSEKVKYKIELYEYENNLYYLEFINKRLRAIAVNC